jgi:hypothetical protein
MNQSLAEAPFPSCPDAMGATDSATVTMAGRRREQIDFGRENFRGASLVPLRLMVIHLH